MKKMLLVLVTALGLLAGEYSGFMHPKKGSWAKYEIIGDDGKRMISITKYLGTMKYQGKKVHIIESEMVMGKERFVTQQWSAVDDESMIKKVITLTPQGIMCMSEAMFMSGNQQQTPHHLRTPKKYSPKLPHIRYATYTLPNGKKIPVAIFKEKNSEVWVSSKVPFGIVKVISRGKVSLRLIDYGLSGAKAAIPIKEAKACVPISLPFPAM